MKNVVAIKSGKVGFGYYDIVEGQEYTIQCVNKNKWSRGIQITVSVWLEGTMFDMKIETFSEYFGEKTAFKVLMINDIFEGEMRW